MYFVTFSYWLIFLFSDWLVLFSLIVLNCFLFSDSTKRIYTPLKDVSKTQIAEMVMQRHSIKMTEIVMESHTCFNTIDIHDENATAETVFTMLKNSKKIQKWSET